MRWFNVHLTGGNRRWWNFNLFCQKGLVSGLKDSNEKSLTGQVESQVSLGFQILDTSVFCHKMKFFWGISRWRVLQRGPVHTDILVCRYYHDQPQPIRGRVWERVTNERRGKSDGTSIRVSVNLYIRLFVRWMESPIRTSSSWAALSPVSVVMGTSASTLETFQIRKIWFLKSFTEFVFVHWLKTDNLNHRVPILNIGVTKANVKIVKVGSVRHLFIQSSENYWVVGPLLFNDWII